LEQIVAKPIPSASSVRIPTQGGQVFRFDRGHHSGLMAATVPI
jgi:hypothetical protein